eukprot:1952980-Rhodomonas_salina.2
MVENHDAAAGRTSELHWHWQWQLTEKIGCPPLLFVGVETILSPARSCGKRLTGQQQESVRELWALARKWKPKVKASQRKRCEQAEICCGEGLEGAYDMFVGPGVCAGKEACEPMGLRAQVTLEAARRPAAVPRVACESSGGWHASCEVGQLYCLRACPVMLDIDTTYGAVRAGCAGALLLLNLHQHIPEGFKRPHLLEHLFRHLTVSPQGNRD